LNATFVLTALADGPRHGYGIVREVAELSRARVARARLGLAGGEAAG
jgi:DNA-binding PadR family transcriptional regulator